MNRRLVLRTTAFCVLFLANSLWVLSQQVPGPRGYSQAVFCENTKEIILFGGEKDPDHGLADTWVYSPNANRWQRIDTDPSPGNGEGPMCYDPNAKRVILFQTYNGEEDALLALTWAFDPTTRTWTKLNPSGSPPKGLAGARMVYDRKSAKMILFGGQGSAQTWVFDYPTATWTLQPLYPTPPSRNFHQMIYDQRQNKVIVWGGENDDRMWTYTYGAKKWETLAKVNPPPRLEYASMVYLPGSDAALLFGGAAPPGESVNQETWLFKNQRWKKTRLSAAPPARAWQATAVDEQAGRVYIFGGGPDRGHFTDELWMFDSKRSSWKVLTPSGP